MEMVSINFYLALALFAAAYKTTAAISTPGCTSDIEILKNGTVAQQLESYLRNKMDIIELHLKTNTCIALKNDDNTNSNKTFASASTIEKYNMFIYFIVTNTGRALMHYPADTNTMALSLLGSPKVTMDVDVMLDNHDCALNTEQVRTIFLQTLSTLAPITNNDDISVCYYEVSEKDWRLYAKLLFLPYYTYNNFKTFCLAGSVVTEIPQALPNKLLYWLCIALHLTLPTGFFFIPYTVHDKIDSYRKCDVPFSVSMLLSYVAYLDPRKCCNKKKSDSRQQEESLPQEEQNANVNDVQSDPHQQEESLSQEEQNANVNDVQSDPHQQEESLPQEEQNANVNDVQSDSHQQEESLPQEKQNANVNDVQSDPHQQEESLPQEKQNAKVNDVQSDPHQQEVSLPQEKQNASVNDVQSDPQQQGECQPGNVEKSTIFVLQVLIIIAAISSLIGICIHLCLRHSNYLENDLLILTGSSAFYSVYQKSSSSKGAFYIIVVTFLIFALSLFIWCKCLYKESNEIKYQYPIYLLRCNCEYKKKSCGNPRPWYKCFYDNKYYDELSKCCNRCCHVHSPLNDCLKGSRCQCYDANELTLKTEFADLNKHIKMISEVIFSISFWWTLTRRTKCFILIFAPIVLIFCIPYVNICIRSAVKCCNNIDSKYKCCVRFGICTLHVVILICSIVVVNTTLIQTATLILQFIVLTLFVGIPFYPNLLSSVILLTGFIKYTMQAFLKYQSKSKYVLDQMFKEDIYNNKDEIPKEEFQKVLKQCSSVNLFVVFLKIVALMFVWYTAYFAIKKSPAGLSAWKDVIPSVILLITPDWLSKFIYNEAAENQYIDQCVETAMRNLEKEMNNHTTEKGWNCWPYCSKQTSTEDIELTYILHSEQTSYETLDPIN